MPHLLVEGPAGSGKTTLLNIMCQSISRTMTRQSMEFKLVSPDGGLRVIAGQSTAFTLGLSTLASDTAAAITKRKRVDNSAEQAPILLVVDGWHEQSPAPSTLRNIEQVIVEGPTVGVHLAVSTEVGDAFEYGPSVRRISLGPHGNQQWGAGTFVDGTQFLPTVLQR